MPRPALGPRLWLNPTRKVWVIRDGRKIISTGCRGWKGAEAKFSQYMAGREPEDRQYRPAAANGFVYFITAEHPDFPIKIGFMQRADELRLKGLQTGCPYQLVLLCSVPGTYSDERELHRRFSASRLQGEWFARSPELMAHIDNYRKEIAA